MEETGRREQKCPKCGHTPTSTQLDFQNWWCLPSSSCILCAGGHVPAGGTWVPAPSVTICWGSHSPAVSSRLCHCGSGMFWLSVLPGGVAFRRSALGPLYTLLGSSSQFEPQASEDRLWLLAGGRDVACCFLSSRSGVYPVSLLHAASLSPFHFWALLSSRLSFRLTIIEKDVWL